MATHHIQVETSPVLDPPQYRAVCVCGGYQSQWHDSANNAVFTGRDHVQGATKRDQERERREAHEAARRERRRNRRDKHVVGKPC